MSNSESEDCLQLLQKFTSSKQPQKQPQKMTKKKARLASTLSSDYSDQDAPVKTVSPADYINKAVENLQQAVHHSNNTLLINNIKKSIDNLHHILIHDKSDGQPIEAPESDIQGQITAIQSEMHQSFNAIQTRLDNLGLEKGEVTQSESTLPTPLQTPPETLKTYAQVAKTTPNNKQQKLSPSAKKKQIPEKTSYRERRLVLSDSKTFQIKNALELRDKLNLDFKQQVKAQSNVIAAITKSQKNQNVILITSETYSADFLSQHEKVWQKYFATSYSFSYKDKEWHKVVVHGIPTSIFNYDGGLQLIKQEVETFNAGLTPIAVNWISSAANRASKQHGSVVIAFDNKDMATKALKQRLMIAGMPVRTAEYEEPKSNEQCQKCQKFGHLSNSCKNKPICQFCSGDHITRLHRCAFCAAMGQVCEHTIYKCANCSGNHRASSIECGERPAKKAGKSAQSKVADSVVASSSSDNSFSPLVNMGESE